MEGRRSLTSNNIDNSNKLKPTYSRNVLSNNFISKKGHVSVENSIKHRPKKLKAEMKTKNYTQEEEKIIGKYYFSWILKFIFPYLHLLTILY